MLLCSVRVRSVFGPRTVNDSEYLIEFHPKVWLSYSKRELL